MRAELTNQLKEKFFAMYWGQDVMGWIGVHTQKVNASIFSGKGIELKDFLILRSIDQISEEEAIDIAQLLNQHEIKKHYSDSDLDQYLIMKGKEFANRNSHYLVVSDYLRSRGFAIEFMGHSVKTS